ncbi:hypothetical protein BU24DRAFT_328513, partial [Aaosphaeria arxii CBS 175.79]
LLAPHLADDIDVVQRHISKFRTSEPDESQTYKTLLHDSKNPIVYLSVPRYRIGLRPEIGPGKEQLEIIEQIMGPFKREVIELYFNHIHHNFPILDDETCHTIRHGPIETVPRNLLCVIYANSAPNWRKSETLKMHARPDFYYIWNKAISAVLEDFLSPSLATISAALLDQAGRPSVSIMGNITLCGRNISLAQSFGLHRDPTKWEISENEKSTRVRLWWGVLIVDYWNSMAYGAPPHVRKGEYDVPLPTVESLLSPKATPFQKCATNCFVHLCSMSLVLGDLLSLVYRIGRDPVELSRKVETLRATINTLETQLPEWRASPNATGVSNLWFCFLSMRVLLSRVGIRAAVMLDDTSLEATRLDELRVSSSAVLDFLLHLRDAQFQDFWLPHAAHLLVLAVNVSLRCAVDTNDLAFRNTSIRRLERVMVHIQDAHDNYDWDIAKHCLERCSELVAKISRLVAREGGGAHAPVQVEADAAIAAPDVDVGGGGGDATTATAMGSGGFDDSAFLLSDVLDPNAFDFSWEALWETPSGIPNFTI